MMLNVDQEMAKAVRLAQSGKLKPAVAILEKLAGLAPASVPVRYNLALFLLMAGRHAQALPHLDRILAAHPGHPPSLFSKAKGLMALDRVEEALPILHHLAATDDPESLLALGNALRQLQRVADAVAVYRRLAEVAPAHPGGHVNLGLLLVGGDPDVALPALENAVRHHPGIAELQAMLGQVLLRLRRLDEAAAHLGRALTIDPTLAPAKGHLLRLYRETADWDREETLFQDIRAGLDTAAARRQLAVATQEAIFHPFTGAEILRIAGIEADFRVAGRPRPVIRPRPKAPAPLVVGYLSPDYREHATMHLAGDVFLNHDRGRVRPIAYSVGPDDGSPWRDKVAREADAFVDLSGLGDRAAAERIAADGVHLLVDMSVFTRHARPGIAALRPAPIQAAWLGLAASSGAQWLDYAIVDKVLAPPEHRAHFSERLIHLPDTYQANQAWTPCPASPPGRSELGLPENATVFCSFNGHRKLDRASFGLWLRVLSMVPGAVLWQLAPPEPARLRLERAARDAGIDPSRLIWAPVLPRPDHLARIPAADLFLDALVCGAHTTAADALRMGVPLVSVAGPRLASRVASSLLHAVGLPDLSVPDSEAMVELAVALGRDPVRRSELRNRLQGLLPNAPAFAPARFTRHLETAFEQVWQRHAAGKPPADITVLASD
ncbi:tetratricopeptide repeat protein [Magnetospirillum sp. SS-4]|uniref:O-linked N-acetylglucosamine transferase, SPINDLY family protein n=1 Tax=Magnetospirillum sp. SS-4 TaxID=2681465 RepID=UPI0020C59113|nr:tetratricopeptide repeat protein [Magnetospirillum sp. SS-4]